MIPKPVDTITKADVDQLVTNAVKEGRQIEYKLKLPDGTDKDKREFLADVSSFANSAGGDLLFGIRAEDGVPAEVRGVVVPNTDQEELRLTSVIRDGIQTRIAGISIRFIAGFADGPVVLIRIPKSWNPPHMVVYGGSSRFFIRDGAGKHQMDLAEIRSAFALSEQLPERIRHFRDERIGRLLAGDSPIGVPKRATMMLHLIPVVSFSPEFQLELKDAHRINNNYFPAPLGRCGFNLRFNLDGLLTYNSENGLADDSVRSYFQLFRSGRIESVETDFTNSAQKDRPQTIPAVQYEVDVTKAVTYYFSMLKTLAVSPPLVCLLSMIGVRGALMGGGPGLRGGSPIDRDILLLPDVVIQEYGEPEKILRPIFDAVWNACGFPQSLNYVDGRWSKANL